MNKNFNTERTVLRSVLYPITGFGAYKIGEYLADSSVIGGVFVWACAALIYEFEENLSKTQKGV